MNTSEIKVGDVVHARGVVTAVHDWVGEYRIELRNYCGVWGGVVAKGEIVHVEPRPLQVGDKVRNGLNMSSPIGEIRALDKGVAWVLWPSGHYTTLHVNNLVRA